MIKIISSNEALGAKITGLDLSKTLSNENEKIIMHALGQYGQICFPNQKLKTGELKSFSKCFGTLEINIAASSFCDKDHPEVMILSNIIQDGKPLELFDAGQDWHTDMYYSKDIAFANVLYGLKIPRREGIPLGCTKFADMHAAYDTLPETVKKKLKDATATHDFDKFWENMRQRPGSKRPPLSAEQRRKKPPVSHPIFMTHPITGRKVLYANPGYTMFIDGWEEKKSLDMLNFLFKHQLQKKFIYEHKWSENDVIMWDNIGTLHNAVADYTSLEHRFIKRCQVMADKVLEMPLTM